ncbi:MAG TPA: transketolase C-terminal domain-containing protein [Herpetosiphonaceae bacterium]
MSLSARTTPAPEWTEQFAASDREIYRKTLLELAQRDQRIYCLDSDMGGLETSFQASLPGQYIDLGIAEANLMSVAAGCAKLGKIPFVNTMAAFASSRAYEQVKIDIAYNNLPVRIVATHGGLAAAYLGPTHHAQQDLAAMRALPNMTVMTPADAVETAKMVEAAAYLPGPVYIRLGRNRTDLVYHADYDFAVGRAVELRPGHDVTIVAAGSYPVLAAVAAHERLAALGITARVLNMHTLKPLDEAALVAAARETRGIVTVEDHSIIGGLGGAVAETLAERAPTLMRRVGIADAFCDHVGDHHHLIASYGVTPGHLTATVRELLNR